jgi:hypothetical protein
MPNQQLSNREKKACLVIPAVRIRPKMISGPISSYRGIIKGLATPGFSILIWLPF